MLSSCGRVTGVPEVGDQLAKYLSDESRKLETLEDRWAQP